MDKEEQEISDAVERGDFVSESISEQEMDELKEMSKKFPKITSDNMAEKFVEKADLSEYNFSNFRKADFELQPKSHPVSLRLSENLYNVIQQKAKSRGIKTQKFIREALEQAVF